jgi:ribosomal protein L29
MAIIKKKELKALTPDALQKKLKELRTELAKEMSKKATGGAPTKPSTIRNLRRTIAQLLTLSGRKK